MKISIKPFHSLAIGLAYLCAVQGHQAAAMETSGWSHALSKKTYAWLYVGKNLFKNWVTRPVYTYEKPWEIPANLPSIEDIAQQMHSKVPAKQFLRGASTSAHQCGNQCTPRICSWSRFVSKENLRRRVTNTRHNFKTGDAQYQAPLPLLKQPTDKEYPIDWDKHYKTYINYAKDTLKLNSLRFSIEWALVQPDGEHSWNKQTVQRYADMFAYAVKKGITPLVCFHHYTDPCWFLDKGGFEKAKNIDYFANYCSRVYKEIITSLGKDEEALEALTHINEPLWASYNAPAGYAFRGYRQKSGPPSIKERSGLPVVAEVLKNMLEAHVRMHKKMNQRYEKSKEHKDIPEIKKPKIGFLKNIHQIDPANETWTQFLTSPITRFLVSFADMIQNGAVYDFFTSGVYRVHIPFVSNITHTNPNAPGSLDFIGLNYYANRHMLFTKGIKPTGEKCSDNQWYYRYPQGMYRAIVELSERMAKPLNIPLIVAENGIATTDDDKRAQFYHEYLYAINRAMQDGYPVHGYLPWTLADNYEWPSLTDEDNTVRRYGLCEVSSPHTLRIKDGTQKSYGKFTQRMQELSS